MKLLKEIWRTPGLPQTGKVLARAAVRGIIGQQRQLLLIHSAQNGDYKFPGGGVEGAETHAATLRREIREECGAAVTHIAQAFGKVVEYDRPVASAYAVFRMTSFYYVCGIAGVLGEPALEPDEQALGFKPVWVDIEVALQANQLILQAPPPACPAWTARETFVLAQVQAQWRR